MNDLTLSISISPTTATPTTASFSIPVVMTADGTPDPTGTYAVWINGTLVNDGIPIGGSALGLGLNNPTPPGTYSLFLKYSGDSNWNPATSNSVTFVIIGTGSTPVQAQARPLYSAVEGERTRTQIENGEYVDPVYKVSAIDIPSKGTGYDEYSIATLTQGSTREDLTITLDDAGGIASLTGFNLDTGWTAPPKVTITRWTSDGTFIPG